MRQRLLGRVILALALWAVGAAPAPASAGKPPFISLVAVDGLRPDRLGCYGYAGYTSPMIDALCATGVVFERAYAQSSWAPASIAALQSSSYPARHGVRSGSDRLDQDARTLAVVLAPTGAPLVAYTSDPEASARGLLRGFPVEETAARESAALVTWAASQWLAARRKDIRRRGGLMYLRFADARLGQIPPPEYLRRFVPGPADQIRAQLLSATEPLASFATRLDPAAWSLLRPAYDAGVALIDASIEYVLQEVQRHHLLDQLWLVIVAPHGEALGEHGLAGHGHTLYEEAIHVPLIVVPPASRLATGRRYAGVVELVDVAPLIADVVGIAPDPSWQGRSLLPVIEGRNLPPRGARAELLPRDILRLHTQATVSPHGRKRIETVAGTFELYNLNEDPAERNDLAGTPLRERSWIERWLAVRECLASAECRATALQEVGARWWGR